jgi:hypothetical protein
MLNEKYLIPAPVLFILLIPGSFIPYCFIPWIPRVSELKVRKVYRSFVITYIVSISIVVKGNISVFQLPVPAKAILYITKGSSTEGQ